MRPILICCVLVASFSSCTRHAYYQSPLQANTNAYKAIPLHSEGVAAATYASGGFAVGGANESLSDGVWSFQGRLHRSHNFSYFQAYYGLSGSLGAYRVSTVTQSPEPSSYNNRNLNDSLITARAGNKFFGAWGANAGINFVLPFDNGGEWRVIGPTSFSAPGVVPAASNFPLSEAPARSRDTKRTALQRITALLSSAKRFTSLKTKSPASSNGTSAIWPWVSNWVPMCASASR